MNTAFANRWHFITNKHRACIDIAAVIWAWTKFDPESSVQDVGKLIFERMNGEIKDLNKNFLKQKSSALMIELGIQTSTDCGTFDVLKYRQDMSELHPYSDDSHCLPEDVVSDDYEPPHPILGNQRLTTQFIDLDCLLSKLTEVTQYPSQLQRQPSEINDDLMLKLQQANLDGVFTRVSKLPAAFDDLLNANQNSPGDRQGIKTTYEISDSEFNDMIALVKHAKKCSIDATELIKELIKDAFVAYWANSSVLERYLKKDAAYLDLQQRLKAEGHEVTNGAAIALIRLVAHPTFYRGGDISADKNKTETIEMKKQKMKDSFKQARLFVKQVYGISLKLGSAD